MILGVSITFIITFIVFAIYMKDEYTDWFIVFLMSLFPTILSVLVLGVGVVGASMIVYKDHTFSSPIVSMQDNSETRGSFFLGSGTFKSEPVFWYYTGEHGVYQLRSQLASESTIVYSDDEPRVEWQCEGYDWTNKWLFRPDCDPNEFTFYVPKGSVTSKIDLDARP